MFYAICKSLQHIVLLSPDPKIRQRFNDLPSIAAAVHGRRRLLSKSKLD